jgi:hypothetical protein
MFRAIWAAYVAPWSERTQVQAQVDARTGSGAGRHVAVVHVQHIRVHQHLGEGGGELGGVAPVGGGATAIEQSGLSEDERPRADGGDSRAALVGGPQRVDVHRVADGGPQRAGALGADPEGVVGRHVLPDGAEHLGGTGEFEGGLGRVEQGHHPMTVHGRNVPMDVFLDSRPGGGLRALCRRGDHRR